MADNKINSLRGVKANIKELQTQINNGDGGGGGGTGGTVTVTAGTATSLAEGSAPTVTNSGSTTHAVFDFGIPQGKTGATGAKGAKGTTFTPAVDAAGDLSWSNDGGLTNPATVNLMGPQGPQGEQGVQGASGTAGAAATIAVGTITELAEGSAPTVENVGTNSAAVLDFGIPAGKAGTAGTNGVTFTPSVDSSGNLSWSNDGGLANPATVNIMGPQGATGADGEDAISALTPRGAYSASANPTYVVNDYITYNGSSYVCDVDNPSNVAPTTGLEDDPYWQLIALQGAKGEKGDTGAQGPQGEQGAQGATGADGAAATIAVGTTTTLAAGEAAVVENVGTQNAAVLNFGIPTGADGAAGANGVTFTPAVDSAGDLSWSNDGGLENPATVNIMGPQGPQGEQGAQGVQGEQGAQGADGEPATITIGTTTTTAPGSAAVVENTGTESAAVLNFSIPRGANGFVAGRTLDVANKVILTASDFGTTTTIGDSTWFVYQAQEDGLLNFIFKPTQAADSTCWLAVGDESLDVTQPLTSDQVSYQDIVRVQTASSITTQAFLAKGQYAFIYYQDYVYEPPSTNCIHSLTNFVPFSKTTTYTTEEQVVGTWVDGKPIYRVSINNVSVSAMTSSWATVKDLSSYNIDKFVNLQLMLFTTASNQTYAFNYYFNNGIVAYITSAHVLMARCAYAGKISGWVEYTKTTDTASS